MARYILGDLIVNESKVITEKSLKEWINSPTSLFTLLYACSTEEEKQQYDILLKLYNKNYMKVSREILIDWFRKIK